MACLRLHIVKCEVGIPELNLLVLPLISTLENRAQPLHLSSPRTLYLLTRHYLVLLGVIVRQHEKLFPNRQTLARRRVRNHDRELSSE